MSYEVDLAKKIISAAGNLPLEDAKSVVLYERAAERGQAVTSALSGALDTGKQIDPCLVGAAIDLWGELEMGALIDEFREAWISQQVLVNA
jgi:hypothetical protein